jgi:carbon monoxide dehydrogenase subunit G
MKFTGELSVKAPRAAVYDKLRDARFFASCVDGVRDLAEIGPDRYSAVFETKVAYMKFSFKVTVDHPRRSAQRDRGEGRRIATRRGRSHDRDLADHAQRGR